MSVSSTKGRSKEEKKRKNRLKRAECEKRDLRCTPPIDRLCDCEIEWKLYRRAFSRFVLRSHKFAALLVHRLVATLARQWGLGSRQKKKRHKREKKISLVSFRNRHRPRTKLDRLWRYLRVRPPHVCKAHFYVDVRVRSEPTANRGWICARKFPFCGSS